MGMRDGKLYDGGGEPLMFGQLVLSSMAILDASFSLDRVSWMASSRSERVVVDDAVMLIMKGLEEPEFDWMIDSTQRKYVESGCGE
jgi:hypothetical protein